MLPLALIAALVLAALHVLAGRLRFLDVVPRSRWLSVAGGTSVAYVFVHLLPELAAAQEAVHEADLLLWLDEHVYLVALAGLALFYGVERHSARARAARRRAGAAGGDATATATATRRRGWRSARTRSTTR